LHLKNNWLHQDLYKIKVIKCQAKPIFRSSFLNNKEQEMENFLLVLGITAFAIFLLFPIIYPVHGFHKETALLKKYQTLKGLVNDIKNGKVDFKDFRSSDGIALSVMKDSEIYDKADANTENCLDFGGKVGNNLGDREIVHCFEDANYFKNKYMSNSNKTVGLASLSATSASKATDKQANTGRPNPNTTTNMTSISDFVNENKLINALVKTGKFTEKEAIEFATKTWTGQNERTIDADNQADGIKNNHTVSEDTAPIKSDADKQSSNANKPEDYKDLTQLVHDIKNGNVDFDKMSLNDFQNSQAYKSVDGKMKGCIDFAGKVGNNLGDREIVHCFEDANYFKIKYSS
jgi:polyhydroxyalkanoate synthesis regulator phasin